MSKTDEARKIWSKICEKEREVNEELAVCRKQGRRTERYNNLVADQRKLKAEYEACVGGKPYNPHDLRDVESAADRTARQYLGENR